MSNEQRSLLITIIVSIVATILVLSIGDVVNAASPKIARIYHRNGTVEVLEGVTSFKVLDEKLKSTSVIEISADGKLYRFFNAEVEIETDERKISA